jgi:hypothetical protein
MGSLWLNIEPRVSGGLMSGGLMRVEYCTPEVVGRWLGGLIGIVDHRVGHCIGVEY